MKLLIIIQKQLIALFFFLFISQTDSATNCLCKNFENSIYQVTSTLPGFQPFYLLLTLLPKGVLTETSNLANGNSVAELGVNLQFSVHTGFYDCLTGNIIRANSMGYIYKTDALAVLASNGAIAVHNYYFQFLNNDSRQCTGTLQFAFYTTGSDPTNSNNTATYKSPIANVTCQYLSARGFIIS